MPGRAPTRAERRILGVLLRASVRAALSQLASLADAATPALQRRSIAGRRLERLLYFAVGCHIARRFTATGGRRT
jgi:hypothetical protein